MIPRSRRREWRGRLRNLPHLRLLECLQVPVRAIHNNRNSLANISFVETTTSAACVVPRAAAPSHGVLLWQWGPRTTGKVSFRQRSTSSVDRRSFVPPHLTDSKVR